MNSIDYAMGRLTAWLVSDPSHRAVFRSKLCTWQPDDLTQESPGLRPKHRVELGTEELGEMESGVDWSLAVAIERALATWDRAWAADPDQETTAPATGPKEFSTSRCDDCRRYVDATTIKTCNECDSRLCEECCPPSRIPHPHSDMGTT